MKVLIAHNRYRSNTPSGENLAVDAEVRLLENAGVEVVTLTADSDSLSSGFRGVAQAAPGPVYSHRGVARLRALLQRHRPDVMHVHNVYPLISPWVVRTARNAGVPVVQTLHNYRHSCINGQHFRSGQICTKCVPTKTNWPGVVHGCYRGSRVQSLPMTVGNLVHRSTWRHHVDRFIALTPFMASAMVREGIDSRKVAIRPSWVSDPGEASPAGNEFLFLGRLDQSKGIDLVLQAWETARLPQGSRLRIAGSGASETVVREVAARNTSVVFAGRLDHHGVQTAIRSARVVLTPSTWFEGFPLTIVEAMSHGRPVVVTKGTSPASAVTSQYSWTISPEVPALAGLLPEITPEAAARKGRVARRRYLEAHTPAAATDSLLRIYEEVMALS